jgi:diguanylate cyclase (GGDEF)-like protein
MPHFKYLHRSTFIKDSIWLIGVNAFLLIIFSYFDVFEKTVSFVEKYEYLELDELLPLSVSLTVSLLLFTYRRMVELGKVSQAFEQLAKYDPLTQVLNRRAGLALLSSYYKKAEINKHNGEKGFCLLQLDLDNFKRINDLYGASVGDDVLLSLTAILNKKLPSHSELIRWHSDNFLIILPSALTDLNQQPFEFANTIRCVIEEELFKSDKITCSIGMTLWAEEVSLTHMLHAVEDALLDAKVKKNTVKMA